MNPNESWKSLLNTNEINNATNNPWSWLTFLIAFCWVMTIIFQLEPEIFLLGAFLSLIGTIWVRTIAVQHPGEDYGGGVIGYLIVWLIGTIFYSKGTKTIQVFDVSITVNELMFYFLFLLVVAWFTIRSRSTSQVILFGSSPLINEIILNIWKIGVILQLLIYFAFFKPYTSEINLLFFTLGLFDLFLLFLQQKNLNFLDLIFNPGKLIFSTLSGLSQSLKWLALVAVFVVIDLLPLNEWTVAFLVVVVFVDVGILLWTIGRFTNSSGLLESQISSTFEEGQALAPRILGDLQQLHTEDFKEFYKVTNRITVRKEHTVITLLPNDIISLLPVGTVAQEKAGVFLVKVRKGKPTRSLDRKERKPESDEGYSINIVKPAIYRIPQVEWERVRPLLKPLDRDSFAQEVSMSPEKFEEVIQKSIKGTSRVFEEVHSRIRGVPTWINESTTVTKIQPSGVITLPMKLLSEKQVEEGQEIEIIPGKGEYLCYIRERREKNR